MNRDRTREIEEAGSGICRFVKNPLPECYCVNMTGRKIMKMVHFCADNFRACPIFQRQTQAADEQVEPVRN